MTAADGGPRPELLRADNLHMNDAGYAIWNEIVGPVVARLIRRPKRRNSRPANTHYKIYSPPVSSTARNAFCGMSTLPIDFIRFLPSFCLAHSLRLRVMSPP